MLRLASSAGVKVTLASGAGVILERNDLYTRYSKPSPCIMIGYLITIFFLCQNYAIQIYARCQPCTKPSNKPHPQIPMAQRLHTLKELIFFRIHTAHLHRS